MKNTRVAPSLFLLFMTGCGLFRVTGNVSGAAEPGGPPSPGAERGGAAVVPEGTRDPRQAALYADTGDLTYKTVTKSELDITTLQARYMMPKDRSYEPAPPCGPNPDPKWIKDWPSDSVMANPPVAAWIQSRILRSYAPDLEVAYKAYRDAWKAFDDDLETKRAEALSRRSFYERMAGLRDAFVDGAARVAKLPAGDRVVPGSLHALVGSIVDVYRDAHVSWALGASGTWATEGFRRGQFGNLRAWADDASERRQFAAFAMTGVTPSLIPELPLAEYVHQVKGQGGASVNGWLVWPEGVDVSEASSYFLRPDEAFASKSTRPSIAVPYPSKTIEDLTSETKSAILKGASADEPSLVSVSGVVVGLDLSGDGARVIVEARDEYVREECVEHGAVTGISPDGTIRRQFSSCKVVEQRDTQRRFTVTASAWPKQVDLGDWVEIQGDLVSVATKGSVRSSTVEAAITGRFVGCFGKGEPLDTKSKDYAKKLYDVSHSHSTDCSLATW
ncbi:MAG: hypothetical protein U0414_24595 [Polyangiaceae bacterium]